MAGIVGPGKMAAMNAMMAEEKGEPKMRGKMLMAEEKGEPKPKAKAKKKAGAAKPDLGPLRAFTGKRRRGY